MINSSTTARPKSLFNKKTNKDPMSKLPKQVTTLILILAACFSIRAQDAGSAVKIQVNLQKQKGEMKPIWAWFGYDEPNYTYMKDGRKLLTELAALSPVPVYVRAHSLLVTGDGEAALK